MYRVVICDDIVAIGGTLNATAKMIEELGDVMWYIALTATGLGVTLEEIATYNIEKLSRRYPTGHFRKTDSTERKE